jgi:hypothetical protein
VDKFKLWKLHGLEFRDQKQILNGFSALENLIGSKDISRAWKNIKENIKTSANETLVLYELK